MGIIESKATLTYFDHVAEHVCWVERRAVPSPGFKLVFTLVNAHGSPGPYDVDKSLFLGT